MSILRNYFVCSVWTVSLVCALICALIARPALATAENRDIDDSESQLTAKMAEAYFDEKLAQRMADGPVAGATVAVVRGGELIFAKGYGYSDVTTHRPIVADETLFFPGSVGKLFTWTAVMQLAEQGKLDLQADVNEYLDFEIPQMLYPRRDEQVVEPITLAHLMTHTAGFEDQLAAIQNAGPDDHLPLRDFLIESMPERVYPPGKWFAYSNYGTGLAGYIVERVSGLPFETYIDEKILKPLEMRRSAAVQPLPPALMDAYSQGCHVRDGIYQGVDFEWIAGAPAAPVRATATDMAHFMIAHLNGGRYNSVRILGEASVEAMHSLQFIHDPWLMGMGYGFMVSEENGHSVSWHTGGSAHFSSLLALIPDEDVGFFISYNTPVADLRQDLTDIMDHFYPASVVEPIQPLGDTADTEVRIAALAGTYIPSTVADSTPQRIIGWIQAVTVQAGPGGTLLVGPHVFTEAKPGYFQQVDGPRKLTYVSDENGAVSALFWGPFAYFPVPWRQTLPVQLAMAAVCILIFLSAALAWGIDALLRRRRGETVPARWTTLARSMAVFLGLLNTALLTWFLLLNLNYAETYVYPVAAVAVITRLWWIGVALTVALIVFAAMAWQRRPWGRGWRIHFTVVTAAGVVFCWFLLNWNLLAVWR